MELLSEDDKKVSEAARAKQQAKRQKHDEARQARLAKKESRQKARRHRLGKKIAKRLCSRYKRSCRRGDEFPKGFYRYGGACEVYAGGRMRRKVEDKMYYVSHALKDMLGVDNFRLEHDSISIYGISIFGFILRPASSGMKV